MPIPYPIRFQQTVCSDTKRNNVALPLRYRVSIYDTEYDDPATELISNGDFASGNTDWSPLTEATTQGTPVPPFSNVTNNVPSLSLTVGIFQNITTVIGSNYEIRWDTSTFHNTNNGIPLLQINGATVTTFTQQGISFNSFTFTATQTTTLIAFLAEITTGNLSVGNISVVFIGGTQVQPILDMTLFGEGFELTYEGDEDDLFTTIIPSHVKLFFRVENSDHADFIADIVNYQEERFYLGIERSENSAPYEQMWRGVMIQDVFTIEDTRDCFPYHVELRAIDGLARLKDLDGEVPFTDELLGQNLVSNPRFDPAYAGWTITNGNTFGPPTPFSDVRGIATAVVSLSTNITVFSGVKYRVSFRTEQGLTSDGGSCYVSITGAATVTNWQFAAYGPQQLYFDFTASSSGTATVSFNAFHSNVNTPGRLVIGVVAVLNLTAAVNTVPLDINSWIIGLLKEAAPIELWIDNETFLAHNAKWYDAFNPISQDGIDPTDPFRMRAIDRANLLYDPDDSVDGRKYYKWDVVMDKILRAYGCRIFMDKGRFNVVQLEQYELDGSNPRVFNYYYKTYRQPSWYDPNHRITEGVGAYNQTETLGSPDTFITTYTGNEYQISEQYGRLQINYELTQSLYLIWPVDQKFFTWQCTNVVTEEGSAILFDVDNPNGGFNLRMFVTITEVDVAVPTTYTLINVPINTGGGTNNAWQWSASPPSTSFTIPPGPFQIQTPAVPEDCRMCVRVEQTNGTIVVNDLILKATNVPQSDRATYVYDFTNNGGKLALEYDNPIFGTAGIKPLVPTSYAVSSFTGAWQLSSDWRGYATTADEFHNFWAKHTMGILNQPNRRKYYGRMWTGSIFFTVLFYDDVIYVQNRCKLMPSSGYWDVVLLEILKT